MGTSEYQGNVLGINDINIFGATGKYVRWTVQFWNGETGSIFIEVLDEFLSPVHNVTKGFVTPGNTLDVPAIKARIASVTPVVFSTP